MAKLEMVILDVMNPLEEITIPSLHINTSKPRQNGRHFPDDIFKRIYFNENVWVLIYISPQYLLQGVDSN